MNDHYEYFLVLPKFVNFQTLGKGLQVKVCVVVIFDGKFNSELTIYKEVLKLMYM